LYTYNIGYAAQNVSLVLQRQVLVSTVVRFIFSRLLPIPSIMVSLGRFETLYRSTLFQIVIVGLVAFCEPGIWTALNNLGAGGNAKVGSCFALSHWSM
jgi:hypothetical protein